MALKYAGIAVEHREIALRDKPKSMLMVSPKGTVPVLCVENLIIDQSLEIMHWALNQFDPQGWNQVDNKLAQQWIDKNDGPFKQLLDQYKYPNRFPELSQESVLEAAYHVMLAPLESALKMHSFLMGNNMTWVDVAIFPFIRQFSMVNPEQFKQLPLPATKKWLQQQLDSDLFESIMVKYPTWIERE